jgi:hypothetical protein
VPTRTLTTIYDLDADNVDLLRRYKTEELTSLAVGDVVIDLDDRFFRTRTCDDRAERIAALERLAELALQAASELRTGRPDTDTTTANTNA